MLEDVHKLSFDDILSNQIKFGKCQIQILMVTSLIDFLDGAEFMFVQLLNPILYKEWNLNLFQLIILGGIFNFGLFCGSLLSGFFADAIGRKSVLIFGCFVQFLAVFLTAFVINLPQLLSLRLIIGMLYGIMLPLSQIIVTEVTPIYMRGKFIVALQMTFILGRMWTVLMAAIFLDNITEGNWRAIALCNSIPCFVCLIGTIFLIRESPRFLICQGKIAEGVEGINHMGKTNNADFEELSQEQIQSLSEWQVQTFSNQMEKRSIKDLFNKDNFSITWRSYGMISLMMALYTGIILLIPFLLDKEEKNILHLFYTVIVEIPAVVVVFIFIDDWGRLPIAFGAVSCGIISMALIAIWKGDMLMTGLLGFKCFIRMTFLAVIPLIVESYSTVYRTLGIGSTLALGKISGAIAPAILFPIYDFDHYAPFNVGLIALILIGVILLSYPSDKTMAQLDVREEKEEKLD